jgi:hypothetical protein
VAKAGKLHLVTVPVDSATLGVHIYPQTLTWFLVGSPTKEVIRPGCEIDSEQPPAKEHVTALSMAVTDAVLIKVAAASK